MGIFCIAVLTIFTKTITMCTKQSGETYKMCRQHYLVFTHFTFIKKNCNSCDLYLPPSQILVLLMNCSAPYNEHRFPQRYHLKICDLVWQCQSPTCSEPVERGGGVVLVMVPEVVVSRQDADGLQGLAQPHVITQDPVQLVLVQEGQPVHSVLETQICLGFWFFYIEETNKVCHITHESQ